MRKTRTWLMAGLLIGSAAAARAQTPTVDDIVEKSLKAGGGRAALAKIESRLTTGTLTISTQGGEFPGTLEVLNQAPNRVRTLVKIDLSQVGMGQVVMDQRFDGKEGYALDSLNGDHAITGNQLEAMRFGAIFPSAFLDYKAHGTKILLGGKEKVGDRDAYALSITLDGGSVVRLFLDAESYGPIKLIANVEIPQIGTVEQTTEFFDIRDVDGVKVPFRLVNTSSVQTITINVTKVEHNVKVDPSLFVKPAAK